MQISRIGNVNFGKSIDSEIVEKNPTDFYNLTYHGKLNVLYDMFQKAGKERKKLAQNQAEIFEKMKEGFNILANHGDNTYICSKAMDDVFENTELKNL